MKTTIISGLDKHEAQHEVDLYNAANKDKPFKVERYNTKPQNKRPVWEYAVITYTDDLKLIESAKDLAATKNQD